MKNPQLFFLLLLCFCYKTAIGQDKDKIIIPFYLTEYNNISIKAILNGKDTVNLMFHTGSNFVTLTEDATKKAKSIVFSNNIENIKSWGGNTNSARISEKNTLQIGNLRWDNLVIGENQNSGQKTDGKFGLDLFAGKVVAINFEKKVISILSQLPKNAKKYQKLKLDFKDDMLFLNANCKMNEKDYNFFQNSFFIHSGYSGAILLDDKFVADHKLNENLKIIGEKELKDSYGNIVKTKKAILPSLQIGNEILSNVLVGFFEGAIGRQRMSIMGGDILKRFNIIIDAKREYIYLKPNKLKKDKYV